MARASDDLTLKVGFDIDKFRSELMKTNAALTGWANGIKQTLTQVGLGFTALSLGRFALDISRVAGEAEGVKAAFDKLPGSIKLMNDLKAATGGTVSELELMKRSVMASNFDISLKALPQLLEFATIRARQTGQSVNYLVDSIVTGIGRKSKLILDNLGISAVQLTEALGGASAASSTIGEVAEAVGKIASKNLEQMGKLSENAATKLDRLSASWENLKVAAGNSANGTGVLGYFTQDLTNLFNVLSSDNLTKAEKLRAFFDFGSAETGITSQLAAKDYIMDLRKANEETQKLADAQGTARYFMNLYANDMEKIKAALKGASDETTVLAQIYSVLIEQEKAAAATIRNEKNLTEEINNLRDEATLAIGNERVAINLKIKALEKEIETLKTLGAHKEWIKGLTIDSKSPEVSTNKDEYFKTEPLFNGDIEIFKEELEGINEEMQQSMFVSDQLRNEWEKTKQTMENMGRAAASVGEEIGFAIGSSIVGTEDFAQSMAQMARRVIRDLKAIAMAYMIKNSVQFGGPLGIGLAVAGMGILEGLFAKLGSSGGDSVRSGMAAHSQTLSNGQVVQFRVQGSDLVGTLDNYNRSKGRTGN